ncbi:hypothetical protein [Bradyrhizobium lablabi]|uniref:Uncharacterized protein n=1 Tax=Bradyrhizobium lablabi TaxID=722472 RepID=A0A1H5JL42_9BRAD|nr:hypothetical protein [Bradyrhizobium lablabi]SEE52338.1 hypothetical protein SAMN05444171_7846 [Bradyrhizobium lablabi]
MSQMVERVARAIGCMDEDRCSIDDPYHEGMAKCPRCLNAARAAIEAMREPPKEMGWPESLSQYWRAGIDGALK